MPPKQPAQPPFVREEISKALADLRTNKITKVYMSQKEIIDAEVVLLANELKVNTSVQLLNLSWNRIGDDGAKSLAEALKVNNSVLELDLSSNSLGAEGVKSLAEALKVNSSVQRLSLNFNQMSADEAKSLAEALKVNNSVLELDLSSNSLGAEGATSLAEALKVNNSVQLLYLKNNSIGPDGAKSLAEALKVNNSVQQLILSDNSIGPDGAKSLAEALKVNNSVQQLILSNNSIGADGAKSLADVLKVNNSVQRLDLSGNGVGADGAKSLAEALKVNNSVQQLILSDNSIGADGAISLAEALKVNNSVQRLDLSGNGVGADGAKSLAEAIKVNTSVQRLDLSGNGIGVDGVKSLADALKVNSSVQELYLDSNSMGADGAKSLAEALKVNSSVQRIGLKHNTIGADGVKSLADALKVNSSVQCLYFRGNLIGSDGATSLAEALKVNNSVQCLALDNNSIGADGATSLAEALKVNNSVQQLDLDNNSIGDDGATSLAEALKVNSSVQMLDLRNNLIGADGAKSLAEALKVNNSLQWLNLCDNSIGDAGVKSLAEALTRNTALRSLSFHYGAVFREQISKELERNGRHAEERSNLLKQWKINSRKTKTERRKTESVRCPVCFCALESVDAVLLGCSHWMCVRCARVKAQFVHAHSAVPSAQNIERHIRKLKSNETEHSVGRAAFVAGGGTAVEDRVPHITARRPLPYTDAATVRNTVSESFECPLCTRAAPYTLADEGLGYTVRAAAVQSRETIGDSIICDGGCGRVSDVHCVECDVSYCTQCASATHGVPRMRTHRFEAVTAAHAVRRVSERTCAVHGERLSLCCVEDEVPVCSQCLLVGQHRRKIGDHWTPHECVSVSAMVKTLRNDMENAINGSQSRFNTVRGAHANVAAVIKQLHQSRETAFASVSTWVEEAVRHVRQVGDEKRKEVEDLWERKFRALEWQIGVLGSGRAYLTETISNAQRVLMEGSADEYGLIDVASDVLAQLKAAYDLCQHVVTPVVTPHITFTGETDAAAVRAAMHGRVT